MSDTLTSAEPQAPPVPTPAPQEPTQSATPASSSSVAHTPGGIPAIPAVVSASNTVVGLISAAAVTGGPVAAAAAAAGAAALTGAGAGAVAARRGRQSRRSSTAQTRKALRQPARTGSPNSPAGSRGSPNAAGGARGRRKGGLFSGGGTGARGSRTGAGAMSGGARGGKSGKAGVPRQSGSVGLSTPSSTRRSAAAQKSGRPGTSSTLGNGGRRGSGSLGGSKAGSKPGAGGSRSAPGRVKNAAGALKNARASRKETSPTRQSARKQATADRRNIADARRNAKMQRKQAKAAAKDANTPKKTGDGTSSTARAGRLSMLKDRARRRMSATREKHRDRRDNRGEEKVGRVRRMRRLSDARWRMHRRIMLSHSRYWGRRVLAAVAALPVGVLGTLTTPLGRRLGVDGLMYPGRRLHHRLITDAQRARKRRDALIRDDHHTEKAALEADETHPVADRVPRAPRHHNAGPLEGDPMSETTAPDTGFNFEETAASMEEQALKFEPEGMMQVLATCENMPQALTHIADTFKHLAERSDEEFPLEKEVGESLGEVYSLLMKAVEAAEEVGTTFRKFHEHDVARHEEPRTGEETWDTTNNQ